MSKVQFAHVRVTKPTGQVTYVPMAARPSHARQSSRELVFKLKGGLAAKPTRRAA